MRLEPEHRLCGSHRVRDVAHMAKIRGTVDLDSPSHVVRGEVHPYDWQRSKGPLLFEFSGEAYFEGARSFGRIN
jgi:hypothetical protein